MTDDSSKLLMVIGMIVAVGGGFMTAGLGFTGLEVLIFAGGALFGKGYGLMEARDDKDSR